MSRQDRVTGRVQPRGWYLIHEFDLTAAGAISFTNIPQSYVDLQILGRTRSNTAGTNLENVVMRINADAGSNYRYSYHAADDAAATHTIAGSVGAATAITGITPGGTSTAGAVGTLELEILGYTSSMHKPFHFISAAAFASSANRRTDHGGGVWGSTAAITQIDIAPSTIGNSFAIGTRLALLGRR